MAKYANHKLFTINNLARVKMIYSIVARINEELAKTSAKIGSERITQEMYFEEWWEKHHQ